MHLNAVVPRVLMFAAVAVSTLATPAVAQDRFRGTVRVGGDFGGEKVIEFTYSDGSTPDMTAGAGFLATIGGIYEAYRSGANSVDLQVNAGVKYRTIPEASNQSASWTRFPVEALVAFNTASGVRVAGGVTAHLANTLKASGGALNDEVDFKTTPGFVVQAEYVFPNKSFSFDLRYTAMQYEVDGGSGTVDANSFGGGFSWYFGFPKGN